MFDVFFEKKPAPIVTTGTGEKFKQANDDYAKAFLIRPIASMTFSRELKALIRI